MSHVTAVFNEEGPYFEDGDLNDDKSFEMTGTVKTIDLVNNTQVSDQNPIKTAGFLMVPSKDSETVMSSLTTGDYKVLGSYTFNDLRGGQKGTGSTQTILVWGVDNDG